MVRDNKKVFKPDMRGRSQAVKSVSAPVPISAPWSLVAVARLMIRGRIEAVATWALIVRSVTLRDSPFPLFLGTYFKEERCHVC